MAKGIVIYYSRSGHTKQMADIIAEAMNDNGLGTDCKSVTEIEPDDVLKYDAIVVGSPTYYGHMAAEIKKLFDELVTHHGQLETTIMGIIEAMLISGMIVEGDPKGDHYGPVSIGNPDDRVHKQCKRRGQRIAQLTLKLFK
ncbi:MAG: flavodoxin family protein [Planctomycetota bacterium]|jgi:NAD(P)H dehydrogenase (quinone)